MKLGEAQRSLTTGATPNGERRLAAAARVQDLGLVQLTTDPLMDPLRKRPRFQAVMRELKFPD